MSSTTIVGYWKYSPDDQWPVPVQGNSDNSAFVKALDKVEAWIRANSVTGSGDVEFVQYRGYSVCRICKWEANGDSEYVWKGFRWPDGLRHYLIPESQGGHALNMDDYPIFSDWKELIQNEAGNYPDVEANNDVDDNLSLGLPQGGNGDDEDGPALHTQVPLPEDTTMVKGDEVAVAKFVAALKKVEEWIQKNNQPRSGHVEAVNLGSGIGQYVWKGYTWPESLRNVIHQKQLDVLSCSSDQQTLLTWASTVKKSSLYL